jgi:putative RecB family exonuclease
MVVDKNSSREATAEIGYLLQMEVIIGLFILWMMFHLVAGFLTWVGESVSAATKKMKKSPPPGKTPKTAQKATLSDATARSQSRPAQRRRVATGWPYGANPNANPQVPPCGELLPEALSPSSANTYRQCPRKFYESKIVKRVLFQGTVDSTKGTLVHYALEKIFEDPQPLRSKTRAVSFIRPRWIEILENPELSHVRLLPPKQIEEMLNKAELAVQHWFTMENPKLLEPHSTELKIESNLQGASMRGIIDRVDIVQFDPQGKHEVEIVDYKTGKFKAKYLTEPLFQINTYAAAVTRTCGFKVKKVKLLYVSPGQSEVVERPVTNASILRTEKKFKETWSNIERDAMTGKFPCKVSPLCNWCDAKSLCPAWA